MNFPNGISTLGSLLRNRVLYLPGKLRGTLLAECDASPASLLYLVDETVFPDTGAHLLLVASPLYPHAVVLGRVLEGTIVTGRLGTLSHDLQQVDQNSRLRQKMSKQKSFQF